ncbi:MAG: hypothetical protein IK044_03915 [Methanobrevibacter sp.]|nr:hypothetical protein [Methanobrevibacter sp.]
MKFKKNMFCLIILVLSVLNNNKMYEKYNKLETHNFPSIKKENLPKEFSNSAFKTVDTFIKKMFKLDNECVIYFDYITGEILRCSIGNLDNVEINFKKDEFKGYHVASLHNHPLNVFSPPSGKNFGIFAREFEDYELISGRDRLWILEAKGVHEYLVNEMNIICEIFFNSSLEKCANRHHDEKIIDKMANLIYGNQLSKYINDKNINGIRLTKTEYVNMNESDIETAEYTALRIVDPEIIRLARERERDPTLLSGKDRIYALYQMMGMEINYDEIFPELDIIKD